MGAKLTQVATLQGPYRMDRVEWVEWVDGVDRA